VLWEYAFLRNDMDIDSDNNNGYELPDSSSNEEQFESIIGDPERPGKIIYVDTIVATTVDEENTLPGFANFNAIEEKTFIPLSIAVSQSEGQLENTYVTFSYYASDPSDVTSYIYDFSADDEDKQYFPAPGVMRIWTKNSNEERSPLPVDLFFPGDFVKPNRLIALNNLPAPVNGKIVLYVETVGLSEIPGSFLIQMRMEPLI